MPCPVALSSEPSGTAPPSATSLTEAEASLLAAELKQQLGLTVLMAEQNFEQATRIADRGYVLVHGRVELAADNVEELRRSDVLQRLYLGID